VEPFSGPASDTGTIVGEGMTVGASVAGSVVAGGCVATGVGAGVQEAIPRINAIVITKITFLAIFIQSPSPTGLPQVARYYNAGKFPILRF